MSGEGIDEGGEGTSRGMKEELDMGRGQEGRKFFYRTRMEREQGKVKRKQMKLAL